MTIVEEIDN